MLKVVCGDQVIDASSNPTLELGDIIGVRGPYADLIADEEQTAGSEVDEPRAHNVEIEVADIHVGKSELAGKTIVELGEKIGFGTHLKALFRHGQEIPHLPKNTIETGDVLRLAGPKWCVVIWIAVLGLLGALVPPLLAWLYGLYIRKMNPAVLAGACAGGRNSTPALKAAQDACRSAIPAVGYPVPYALTSIVVLILGFLAMVLS